MAETYKLVAENPPQYFTVEVKEPSGWGKGYKTVRKRKYYTANIWYGIATKGLSTGKNERKIRATAKKNAIWFLKSYMKSRPKLTKFPLRVTVEYHHPMSYFDLHNKCFFWSKIFQDYIGKNGLKCIPDDDVKYIQEEIYRFIESKERKLVFILEPL